MPLTTRRSNETTRSPRALATVAVVALLATAGAFALPAAVAQDGGAPLPPAAYYGNVTVAGEPAPAGTEVVAVVDGEERGSLVVDDPGTYGGSSATEPKLTVDGSREDAGATVTFRVDGQRADQTATWEAGAVVKLDLSVGGEASGGGESGDGDRTSGGDGTGDEIGDGDETDDGDGTDDGDETGDGEDDDATARSDDSAEGTHDATSDGDSSDGTSSVRETTNPDDGTTDSGDGTTDSGDGTASSGEESPNSGGLPGFGLVVTVGALLVGVGLARRRS